MLGWFERFLAGAICLTVAACATAGGGGGKEKVEAMLNTELATGDDADAIEGFFHRHGIAYTFDASIRRYAGTVEMGAGGPFSVYVYTDTDKKMTVSLVQAPKPQATMQRPRRTQDYILDDARVGPSRPPR
jgi:hypothetical protein